MATLPLLCVGLLDACFRLVLVETAYVIDLCRQVLGILGVFGRVAGDIFVKHVKIEDVLESGDAWYIVKKK